MRSFFALVGEHKLSTSPSCAPMSEFTVTFYNFLLSLFSCFFFFRRDSGVHFLLAIFHLHFSCAPFVAAFASLPFSCWIVALAIFCVVFPVAFVRLFFFYVVCLYYSRGSWGSYGTHKFPLWPETTVNVSRPFVFAAKGITWKLRFFAFFCVAFLEGSICVFLPPADLHCL